jgi:hypothetical protein
MAKIGLWLELEAGIGFLVGLGSLTGQRTTTTILLIALDPILAHAQVRHRRLADDDPRRLSRPLPPYYQRAWPTCLRRAAPRHPHLRWRRPVSVCPDPPSWLFLKYRRCFGGHARSLAI